MRNKCKILFIVNVLLIIIIYNLIISVCNYEDYVIKVLSKDKTYKLEYYIKENIRSINYCDLYTEKTSDIENVNMTYICDQKIVPSVFKIHQKKCICNGVSAKYAIVTVSILTLIILTNFIFITIILRKILTEQIYCDYNYYSKNIGFILSLIFMIIMSYFVHLIPFMINKFSLNFVIKICPKLLEIALYEIYVIIWLAYIYIILFNYYKKCVIV